MTAAVLATRIAVGDGYAQALEHVGEALRREHGLPLVASAGETDPEPIADELVVADAFDRHQVFEPGGAGRRWQ
jgi:hypothetical protein